MKCPNNLLAKSEITKILKFPKSFEYFNARSKLVEEYCGYLDDYYHGKGVEANVGYQTLFLPGELLKNAYHHGEGNNHLVSLGIFLSPKIVIVGCNDGGSYFKDSEIKKMWEKRIPIESKGFQFDKSHQFISGANIGRRVSYAFTDEIFIDNKLGTFFGKFNPLIYLLSYDEIVEIQNERKKSRANF